MTRDNIYKDLFILLENMCDVKKKKYIISHVFFAYCEYNIHTHTNEFTELYHLLNIFDSGR